MTKINTAQKIFIILILIIILWLGITFYQGYAKNKDCYLKQDILINQSLTNKYCNNCLYMQFQNSSYFFAWEHNITRYKVGDVIVIKLCYYPQDNKTYVRGINLFGEVN